MEQADILRQMQEYYARRAPIYDQSMGYDDPARTAAHSALIEFLQASFRGQRVLEIACGPGYWTRQVALSAATILAVDVNDSVLL